MVCWIVKVEVAVKLPRRTVRELLFAFEREKDLQLHQRYSLSHSPSVSYNPQNMAALYMIDYTHQNLWHRDLLTQS